MRIQVYCDNYTLMDTQLESLKIINPKLTQEINKVGSFTFTIYPDHPYYNNIIKMKSIITVYEEGIEEPLFRGRVYDEKEGFYNEKQVSCEGELAFLLDSIQRPWNFKGSPTELLAYFIEQHNSQMDSTRQFALGNVTVVDANDYITRADSGYSKTWDAINEKLIKGLGGYLWTRHQNGIAYIDYLQDFDVLSNQAIEFGKNLVDLSKQVKATSFATAIIPLGAKITDEEGNETGERITIADVNEGVDYVYNADAVAIHGYIFTTNTWDDVTQASNLKRKAQEYIDGMAQFTASINISAADLNGATIDGEPVNVNSFRIGRYVSVKTKPHGIDQNFIVSKLTRELLKPETTKLTLGASYKTLTEKQKEMSVIKGADGANGKDGKDAAVQASIAPTDTTQLWVDTSSEPPMLKRYNGTEWVVVNDMSNEIVMLEQNFTTAIEDSEERQKTTMSENYYTKGETSELVSSVQSSWEQTARGFEANFTTINKDIEDVMNGTDAKFNEMNSYIRFEEGNIILGKSGSQLTLKIENDRIAFIQNNNEVAYFSDNKLNVTEGEFEKTFKIGNFAFIPRANNNLSFKKIV